MQLKVYYIEDEADLCAMFSENFSTSQIVIQTFEDPQLALKTIQDSPPDVLFLDYRLPGVTGDDLAQAITIPIPMVLLSGDLELKTMSSFARKFCKQPFPWSEIEEFLNEQLALKSSPNIKELNLKRVF